MIRKFQLTALSGILLLTAACSTTHHTASTSVDGSIAGDLSGSPEGEIDLTEPIGGGGGEFASLDDLLDEPIAEEFEVNDPFETLNRALFTFNDNAYRYVLDPSYKVYSTIIPRPLRVGIANIFENARYPERAINQVLQGKTDIALRETGKFIVDSTIGIGGFGRPSQKIAALDVPSEDSGQTLGDWGLKEGPYIILPLLGPSNLRDGVGRIADTIIDPTNYLPSDMIWRVRGAKGIAEAEKYLHAYDSVNEGSFDPYTATREAYTQMRRAAIEE